MIHYARHTFAGAILAIGLSLSSVAAHADNVQNAIQAINVVKQIGGLFSSGQPAAQPQQPVQQARSQAQASPLSAEQQRNVQYLSRLNPSDWIAYGPSNPSSVIYAFTDATCPYSQQLHNRLDQLTSKGVQVRVVNWPRGTESGFKVHANAWCSNNPRASLDKAMRGQSIPTAGCTQSKIDELKKQYQVGLDIGVTGTPKLVLEDGFVLAAVPNDLSVAARFAQTARLNMSAHTANQR